LGGGGDKNKKPWPKGIREKESSWGGGGAQLQKNVGEVGQLEMTLDRDKGSTAKNKNIFIRKKAFEKKVRRGENKVDITDESRKKK